VVLVAFAFGVAYANQARLSDSIDRDLRDRATHLPPDQRMGFGPGNPPPANGPDGQGEDGGPLGPGRRQGLGPGPRRQFDQPPDFDDPVAQRFAELRRPRVFSPQGEPLGRDRSEAFDRRSVAAAMKGPPLFSNAVYEGQPIRVFTMRLGPGPGRGNIVQVARDTRELERAWSSQLLTLALFLPVAIIAAALGAFFLTRRATKPIAEMKAAANAISESDLSKRLRVEGEDEFAELGETFNAMVDRLENSFGNLKSAYASLEAAHETQKRFTADASHELRTPLTRLRLATSSALSDRATDAERQKALEVADAAAESMSRLVQEMLVLAKADAGQLRMRQERIDLRVLAAETIDSLTGSGPDVVADMQDSPVNVDGDRDHLQRMLTNLIENAVRHTPVGGTVKVTVCAAEGMACLKVADTGEGVAPEHLPRLTERFYRVDSARAGQDGGSGLGLAICKTIVEAHGGTLEIASQLGKGTQVTVRLPNV
jgi:signal transduction histidine kinase